MVDTNISWTHRRNADGTVTKGATWNPTTGCSHVSEGCRHCYAETLSRRHGWSKKPWTAQNASDNVRLHHSRLSRPFHWRKPRMVFVNSMSDLFHELIPDEFIDQVFAVMALAWQHTYQVLTKRAARMQSYMASRDPEAMADLGVKMALAEWGPILGSRDGQWLAENAANVRMSFDPWPLPNVWLGVSCEDQKNFNERIPDLLETPAAIRFLSCEPLLGPIDLTDGYGAFRIGDVGMSRQGVDWVIAGGESGRGYRPMDMAWARSLRDQCAAAGVPFFMKQQAGLRPGKTDRLPDDLLVQEFPQREQVPA